MKNHKQIQEKFDHDGFYIAKNIVKENKIKKILDTLYLIIKSFSVVVDAPDKSLKICLSICVSTFFANFEAVLFSRKLLTTDG